MRPSLIKSLNLWDVVAMNIVAVASLRGIARIARWLAIGMAIHDWSRRGNEIAR